MGVPGFFQWLLERNPAMMTELRPGECDALYLDANAPVHTCSHGDPTDLPADEDEILRRVLEYLDHLMKEVQPRRLLYIGMDGVAPRAKMNQQRARRFMAVREQEARREFEAELRERWKAEGLAAPEPKETWDHNVITPGTPFMARLSKVLRHYIATRVESDPLWRNLIVFFSDSNEPSEGEHKILQFMKRQRQAPGYDPNTVHYIVGPDADLIQLALCTHEPHVHILRESPNKKEGEEWACGTCWVRNFLSRKTCRACNAFKVPPEHPEALDPSAPKSWCPPFRLLSIPQVRAYFSYCLEPILTNTALPEPLRDPERLYDDLILLFCFIGNDFIPHLPSMRIHENALGRALMVYTQIFPALGGYITEAGEINLPRLQGLLDGLVAEFNERGVPFTKSRPPDNTTPEQIVETGVRMAWSLNPFQQSSLFTTTLTSALDQRTTLEVLDFHRHECVKVGTSGWQERYLREKFGLDPEAPDYALQYETLRATLSRDYLLALVWVVRYYYHQCRCWSWFFPHHFAPPLSLINAADLQDASMDVSAPLRPFEQLLCVLPLASAERAVPGPLYNTISDPEGSLLQYYPTEFEVDLHNCPPHWMSVVELPFVDEDHLLAILRPVEDALKDRRARNRNRGRPSICVCHRSHPLAARLSRALAKGPQVHKYLSKQLQGIPVSGKFLLSAKLNPASTPSPIPLLPDLTDPEVFVSEYLVADGGFTGLFSHNSDVLPGAVFPTLPSSEHQGMVHPSIAQPGKGKGKGKGEGKGEGKGKGKGKGEGKGEGKGKGNGKGRSEDEQPWKRARHGKNTTGSWSDEKQELQDPTIDPPTPALPVEAELPAVPSIPLEAVTVEPPIPSLLKKKHKKRKRQEAEAGDSVPNVLTNGTVE